MTTDATDCPICGAAGTRHFRLERWGMPIVECSRCHTAATIVPEDFDPQEIYSKEYYQGGTPDGYGDYAASESVIRREARHTLNKIRAAGFDSGSLLEIGCAYGFFMKEASHSFDCVGVEISDAARQTANAGSLRVAADINDPMVETGGPYDVLVMLDCIEHLVDPPAMIEQAAGLMSPKSAIVLTTGDWGSLFARASGSHWRLLTPPQHLFFFTRAGIAALLGRHGFRIVSFDRPWRWISLGLAAYIATHRRGWKTKIPEGFNRVALPLNLFDCMRVVAVRDQPVR